MSIIHIRFGVSSGDLVINEVMSNNVSTVTDNSGKFEDWIELYNTTNFPISTNGLFITDTITNLINGITGLYYSCKWLCNYLGG